MFYDNLDIVKWFRKPASHVNAARAIEALRTTKLPQVFGALKELTDDGEYGYCAVGIIGKEFGVGPYLSYEKVDEIFEPYKISSTSIWNLNDNGKLTFSEIADKIEETISKNGYVAPK